MLIIESKNYDEMSKRAAGFVIDEINKNPKLTIGLPTGENPIGMYKELIKEYKKKKVDFSRIRCFNLDEYYGISKKNKNSYFNYCSADYSAASRYDLSFIPGSC